MPGGADPLEPPRPPAPSDGPPPLVFDASFVGPILPPVAPVVVPQPPAPPSVLGIGSGISGAPGAGVAPVLPPVTDAVLAIPLGARKLVGQALDLLTRPDAGLRSASFYIGLIALVTVGPLVMLVGLAAATAAPLFDTEIESSFNWPIIFAGLLALAGYIVIGVEARALATAVIGGRAEGRPLALRASISVARRRFWRLLAANLVVGFVTTLLTYAIQVPVTLAAPRAEAITTGLGLVLGTLFAAPFVYVAPAIVLGEVQAFEAIQRSIRLARARKTLALVIALFSIASQFIVLFGVSIGGDVVVRIVDGTGIAEAFPPALVIPLAAPLVFALGTLLFLVEAITVAPAVYAFEALTHYTHGLEVGRADPEPATSIFRPWFTRGLGTAAVIGLVLLVVAITGMGASA